LLELLAEVELTIDKWLEEELPVDVVLVGDTVVELLDDEVLGEVRLDELDETVVDEEEELLEDDWVGLLDDEELDPTPGA
jgi:hypothetical protein